FSAAHRACPSMIAFEEKLPSYAGFQFFDEISALKKVMEQPVHPSVFVLGGAKISDAFSMMGNVLQMGTADRILTCGVTANVFLMATGVDLGNANEKFLADRDLLEFAPQAKALYEKWGSRIELAKDLAYEEDGQRKECQISQVPKDKLFKDVGSNTAQCYAKIIASAASVFVNGPAGCYEETLFSHGTKTIWSAIQKSKGYTVIGGGDTVSAAQHLTGLEGYGYVCTAGGAMVRFLSGKRLPLLVAMER
ncbi:MAG: phosphoglycerate kinase, partial [Sphaerochaetaceae bacterium]